MQWVADPCRVSNRKYKASIVKWIRSFLQQKKVERYWCKARELLTLAASSAEAMGHLHGVAFCCHHCCNSLEHYEDLLCYNTNFTTEVTISNVCHVINGKFFSQNKYYTTMFKTLWTFPAFEILRHRLKRLQSEDKWRSHLPCKHKQVIIHTLWSRGRWPGWTSQRIWWSQGRCAILQSTTWAWVCMNMVVGKANRCGRSVQLTEWHIKQWASWPTPWD